MSDTLVIVPTYNNAGTLGNVLQRCLSHGLPVLVVDDGSTDGTPEILARVDVPFVRHPQNLGKGRALKTGFQEARKQGYQYALTIDSDGQHYPEDIPALLAEKEERTLVLVPREMPLSRIHLRNLKEAADYGCSIVPPMLTFYNGADSLERQMDHIVGKVLARFGLEYSKFVPWQGKTEK